MKKIQQSYRRKGRKYSPQEVLPYIGKYKKEYDGDLIKMNSQRYEVFNKSCTCVECGLEGTYFVKESNCPQETYHFNLYGVDSRGQEVLMTKDHIIPKSKGGKDTIENYQTMCIICNQKKGNTL